MQCNVYKEATAKTIQTWHVLDAQLNRTKSVSLTIQNFFLPKVTVPEWSHFLVRHNVIIITNLPTLDM